VAPLVAIVKPQSAFFEELGPAGGEALHSVIEHARRLGLLVLLDGKRNDIGSTARAYAAAYLGGDSPWGADALTVSPYLGDDSLQPFFEQAASAGAGVFVLVKTSNPGGRLFQDLPVGEHKLYQFVAGWLADQTRGKLGQCRYSDIGAVVGATYPAELTELRQAMPHNWFLVPGFGAQGAGAADVAAAFDEDGLGAIVNSSRGVIFAYRRPEYSSYGEANWQGAVEAAARDMNDQLAAETPASRLRDY